MIKSSTLMLCCCLLFAGCETTQESSDSHYDKVSREIERLKAEGHTIEMGKSGKPRGVKDFEKKLVEI